MYQDYSRPYTALVAFESQAGGSKEGDKDQCPQHFAHRAICPTREKVVQQLLKYKVYQKLK